MLGPIGVELRRASLNDRGDGLLHEVNGNGGRSVLDRTARKFGEGEAALIAVACAEWRGDVVGGHLLKFGEMFFGGLGVAAALVSAGQAKFGGGMKRKNGESFLEGRDSLIVALKLRV